MGSFQHNGGRHRAFTLIEMLIVIAIITIITTIVLVSHTNFNKSFILSNAAYDLGLSLRGAENYGIGSQVASGVANAGYGLHFSAGTNSSFILFGDTAPGPSTIGCHATSDPTAPGAKAGDCVYDKGDELVTTYTLNNSVTIANFCTESTNHTWSCENNTTPVPSPPPSVSTGALSLDIVFVRPGPSPFFSMSGSYSAAFSRACVALTADGAYRYISINAAGEIDANAASCP